MGKKKILTLKAVFDTNVLVSSLIFRGELSHIPLLWQKKITTPLFSNETFHELQKVLTYPKFSLDTEEIVFILEEEILPYAVFTDIHSKIQGVCRDPDDDKFISCAVSGGAEFIVTGDSDLLDIGSYQAVKTISPSDFIRKFHS